MAAAQGQVKDAQNAMSAMQKVSDAQKKLGLDVVGRPPMCHWAVNCIVAIFFPCLAHFLARPDDIKSLSFVGVVVAQIAGYILFEIPFVGSVLYTMLVLYVIFVCLMSEKKSPYQKSGSSGVVDLER